MTPFLQLLLALAVIIAAAKAGGYLSYRLGQPAVLGELIVGILLGPTIVNLLHLPYFSDIHLSEVVHQLAELGVLFLMFLAGLELHIKDLAKSGKVSALAGSLGVILPILLGATVSYFFLKNWNHALFVGLILAATSVSISAQTLMELKVLRSRVGISLLGAAVFDDILVVLLLSIFTALVATKGQPDLLNILWIVVKMVLFIGAASALGFWLLPKLSRRVTTLSISQGLTAFSVVIIFLFAWSAEAFGGMAAITGAFLAGLNFSPQSGARTHRKRHRRDRFWDFCPDFFCEYRPGDQRNRAIRSKFLVFPGHQRGSNHREDHRGRPGRAVGRVIAP